MNEVVFFFGGWEPIARIIVVGTLAYGAMIILLRSSNKRTLSQMNAFDFIITVALGACFGRILTAKSVALAEAIAAFALLIFLQFVVSHLQVRSAKFGRLLTDTPTLLLYKGCVLDDALKRQRITKGELGTALRQNGMGSLDQAEAVVLEPNGNFAVVKRADAGDGSTLMSLVEKL
jgi:uncharacterized membrane protein YcaP (DUF421 family)